MHSPSTLNPQLHYVLLCQFTYLSLPPSPPPPDYILSDAGLGPSKKCLHTEGAQ